MRVSARLILCTVIALAASLVALPAVEAGLDEGLCRSDGSRGTIPADFLVDACFDGKTLQLHNQTKIALHVDARGDIGSPTRTDTDFGLSADASRVQSSDRWLMLPGDVLHIPVGVRAVRVRVTHAVHDDEVYAIGQTVEHILPAAKAGKAINAAGEVDTFAALIAELADDYEQYRTCLAGANWFMQLGCRAVLVRNVGFAEARFGAKVGIKGVDLLLSPVEFIALTHARVENAAELKKHGGTIALAARPAPRTSTPAPRPAPASPPQSEPSQSSPPTSPAEPQGSQAGDTTCDAFLGLSVDAQTSVVVAMMSELHLATGRGDVYVTLGSTRAFCGVMPGTRAIKGIYSG